MIRLAVLALALLLTACATMRVSKAYYVDVCAERDDPAACARARE